MSDAITDFYKKMRTQRAQIQALRHDFSKLSSPDFQPDRVHFETPLKRPPPTCTFNAAALTQGKDAAIRLYEIADNYLEQELVARTLIEAQTSLARRRPHEAADILACRRQDSAYIGRILVQAEKLNDRLSKSIQARGVDTPGQRERLKMARAELRDISAGLFSRRFYTMSEPELIDKIHDMRVDFAKIVTDLSALGLKGQQADLESSVHLKVAITRGLLSPAQERQASKIIDTALHAHRHRIEGTNAALSNILGYLVSLEEPEREDLDVMDAARDSGTESLSRGYRSVSLSNLPQFAP